MRERVAAGAMRCTPRSNLGHDIESFGEDWYLVGLHGYREARRRQRLGTFSPERNVQSRNRACALPTAARRSHL